MRYHDIAELPSALKNNLPKDAKEIYLAVYNNAWNRSSEARDHRIGASPDDIAHREAWSAVKEKYRKQGPDWIRIYGA